MSADPDLKAIDEWLAARRGVADLVESAYKIARGNHRGELPKFMRNAWHDTPAAYRQFLVFLAEYALDAQPKG